MRLNIWVEFEFRIVRMPLLKSYCQRATSVLPSGVCHLSHLGPHLYSKGSSDLTFHGHWHSSRVRCQPSCSGSLAWLGSHPSLATRKDATVEVVLATCHKCSSRLCWSFGPFGPTSLHQRQLRKNQHFGTATRTRLEITQGGCVTLADVFQAVA